MDIVWLAIVIVLALAFGFLNGLADSGSIVATMVSSGAMSTRDALLLASVAEFVGPFMFGVAVAATIGRGIVNPGSVTILVVLAALIGAIIWSLTSLHFAFPSSSTVALVGGLLGATIMAGGTSAVHWEGLAGVIVALLLAPVVGGVLGYLALKATMFLARGATPAANVMFRRLQVITSLAVALAHGTIDAQKTMGIISMSLVAFGVLPAFYVPVWVIAASAGCLALGVALGGSSILRKLGAQMYRIRPVHGFAAQAASAVAVLGSAALGAPISTTQVIGSAVVGVGTAERRSKVRWEVVSGIATAWLLTLPTAAISAAAVYRILFWALP